MSYNVNGFGNERSINYTGPGIGRKQPTLSKQNLKIINLNAAVSAAQREKKEREEGQQNTPSISLTTAIRNTTEQIEEAERRAQLQLQQQSYNNVRKLSQNIDDAIYYQLLENTMDRKMGISKWSDEEIKQRANLSKTQLLQGTPSMRGIKLENVPDFKPKWADAEKQSLFEKFGIIPLFKKTINAPPPPPRSIPPMPKRPLPVKGGRRKTRRTRKHKTQRKTRNRK